MAHLELSIRPSHTDDRLITDDLSSDHRQSLALRGVDLARHDTASRLVLRQAQFTETTARARPEIPDVVRNLHERAGDDVQGAVGLDEGIMSRKGLKLNRMSVGYS